MRLLVRRFVTAEQRKRDDFGITEDDVMEIRQDISTLRFELIDILSSNGMKTPNIKSGDVQCKYSTHQNVSHENIHCFFIISNFFFYFFVVDKVAGKKGKMMERRILKDFQIGIVETISEAVKTSTGVTAGDVFSSIAKAINKRTSSKAYVIHLICFLCICCLDDTFAFSSHRFLVKEKKRIGMQLYDKALLLVLIRLVQREILLHVRIGAVCDGIF